MAAGFGMGVVDEIDGFMDAPALPKGKDGKNHAGGPSPIAVLLDLVGIHREVAKGPKAPAGNAAASPAPVANASVPAVLNDVSSALGTAPAATPLVPANTTPGGTWGQRWIASMHPILAIDPNDGR